MVSWKFCISIESVKRGGENFKHLSPKLMAQKLLRKRTALQRSVSASRCQYNEWKNLSYH
ncbi:hypothetical protein YC2023_010576 [Brassica napus]